MLDNIRGHTSTPVLMLTLDLYPPVPREAAPIQTWTSSVLSDGTKVHKTVFSGMSICSPKYRMRR